MGADLSGCVRFNVRLLLAVWKAAMSPPPYPRSTCKCTHLIPASGSPSARVTSRSSARSTIAATTAGPNTSLHGPEQQQIPGLDDLRWKSFPPWFPIWWFFFLFYHYAHIWSNLLSTHTCLGKRGLHKNRAKNHTRIFFLRHVNREARPDSLNLRMWTALFSVLLSTSLVVL